MSDDDAESPWLSPLATNDGKKRMLEEQEARTSPSAGQRGELEEVAVVAGRVACGDDGRDLPLGAGAGEGGRAKDDGGEARGGQSPSG
jgi:hypothetical protein